MTSRRRWFLSSRYSESETTRCDNCRLTWRARQVPDGAFCPACKGTVRSLGAARNFTSNSQPSPDA